MRAKELRQPGETRAAGPAEIERAIAPAKPDDVIQRQRPRTDRAHVAAQHVDELRELVEASGAQDAAGPRDLPVAHRSELQDVERPAAMAHPLLTKQDRRTVVDQDGDADDGHGGREHDQAGTGTGDVEDAAGTGHPYTLHYKVTGTKARTLTAACARQGGTGCSST